MEMRGNRGLTSASAIKASQAFHLRRHGAARHENLYKHTAVAARRYEALAQRYEAPTENASLQAVKELTPHPMRALKLLKLLM